MVVSSEGLRHEVDGIPEPDDGVLYGRLKNSEWLCDLDMLLVQLPQVKLCQT